MVALFVCFMSVVEEQLTLLGGSSNQEQPVLFNTNFHYNLYAETSPYLLSPVLC